MPRIRQKPLVLIPAPGAARVTTGADPEVQVAGTSRKRAHAPHL
jgi:hypothetical protein